MARYRNYTPEELACRCGCGLGEDDMDKPFMKLMVAIRLILGFALPVSSAIRCPEHNNNVSSTGLDGAHTTGKAIDISCHGKKKFLLVALAIASGIKRIGIGSGFVHLDKSDKHPSPRIWSY